MQLTITGAQDQVNSIKLEKACYQKVASFLKGKARLYFESEREKWERKVREKFESFIEDKKRVEILKGKLIIRICILAMKFKSLVTYIVSLNIKSLIFSCIFSDFLKI